MRNIPHISGFSTYVSALHSRVSLSAALLGILVGLLVGLIGALLVRAGPSAPSDRHGSASAAPAHALPAARPRAGLAAVPAARHQASPEAPRPASVPPKGEIANEAECPGQSDAIAGGRQVESVMLCMVNAARRFRGLRPVAPDGRMSLASSSKLDDMRRCGFSHTACGRAFDYWIEQHGGRDGCSAENIAQGHKTVREVMTGWMASPGHRANILSDQYTIFGTGSLAASRGTLWVQQFSGC